MGLEDEVMRQYREEVAKYRAERESALDIYDHFAAESDYDILDIKRRVFDKPRVQTIEKHEIELRLGTEKYKKWYDNVIQKEVEKIKERADIDREIILFTVESIVTEYPSETDEEFYCPMEDELHGYDSRNTSGFYETTITLPAMKNGKLITSKVFTKFFDKEVNYKKSRAATEFLDKNGLPYARLKDDSLRSANGLIIKGSKIIEKATRDVSKDNYHDSPLKKSLKKRVLTPIHNISHNNAKPNSYPLTTQMIEGICAKKKLQKDIQEGNKESALKTLKKIVEILAKTHILGYDTNLRNSEHFKEIPTKDIHQDYESWFVQKYELYKTCSDEEIEMMGLAKASVDTTMAVEEYKKLVKKRRISPEQKHNFDKIKKYVLDPLKKIQSSRESIGETAFITGDPHLENWIIGGKNNISGIDLETCALGLAEYDLYSIIDDERGLKALGIYDEGKKILIRHYLECRRESLIKRYFDKHNETPEVSKIDEKEVQRHIAIYDLLRISNDFIQSEKYLRVARGKETPEEKFQYEKWSQECLQRGKADLSKIDTSKSLEDSLKDRGMDFANKLENGHKPTLDEITMQEEKSTRLKRNKRYGLGVLGIGATALAIYLASGQDSVEPLPPPKHPVVKVDPKPGEKKPEEKKVKIPEFFEDPQHPGCLYSSDGTKIKITVDVSANQTLEDKCGYSRNDPHKIVFHNVNKDKDYSYIGRGRKRKLKFKGIKVKKDDTITLELPENLRKRRR